MENTPHPPKLRSIPVTKLIPNMLTLAGLCFGMSAIRFAMDARWELSVTLLVAAAIIDGMDGRVARMLNSTSTFGAQLDSLADFLSFGVAPGMVMYLWSMHQIKGVGWAVALFFAVCCALRLARFNTAMFEEEKQAWKEKFFVGVPAPAGALLCVFPMVIGFQIDPPVHLITDQTVAIVAHKSGPSHPALIALVILYVIGIAALMSSRVPTYSIKQIKILHSNILPALVIGAALIGCLIIEPWATLSFVGFYYLISIAFSVRKYRRLSREYNLGKLG